jgi:hypothetical protein
MTCEATSRAAARRVQYADDSYVLAAVSAALIATDRGCRRIARTAAAPQSLAGAISSALKPFEKVKEVN